MKERKTFDGRVMILALVSGTSFAHAGGVTNAALAHNALHQVGHLVGEKTLGATFQNNFHRLTFRRLNATAASAPAVEITVEQIPGPDKSVPTLVVKDDTKGHVVGYEFAPGRPAQSPPVWPAKDPLQIAESSQHWLFDTVETRPELDDYIDNLTSLTLTQEKSAAGKPEARIDLTSSSTPKTLRITVGIDGVVSSGEILP